MMETCSICTEEYLWEDLVETNQGNVCQPCMNEIHASLTPDEFMEQMFGNIWGTPKTDIDPDEYCQECEREVPRHYDTCPLYRK